jgi:threonyl-tRNA synthetase
MLVIGDREVESESVSVRNRFEGDRGVSSLSDFVTELHRLVEERAARP